MPHKIVEFGENALRGLLSGIDLVADLAEIAIGLHGRPVLVERPNSSPIMIKNGYGLSQQIEVEDRAVQAGVQAMREAAWRTFDGVGDGTLRTLILARRMVGILLGGLSAGLPGHELRAVFGRHLREMGDCLQRAAVPLSQAAIDTVALNAAGGDEKIGRLVSSTYGTLGRDCFIEVKAGIKAGDEVELHRDMTIGCTLASPGFAPGLPFGALTIDRPLIVVHKGVLREIDPIVTILGMMARAGRGLVIVADSFEGEVIPVLLRNKSLNGLTVAPLTLADAGPWRALGLADIAVSTGATVIEADAGATLASLRPGMVGSAASVRVSRNAMTIVEGAGDPGAIDAHVKEIRRAVARELHLSFDREQHHRRLARFTGGWADIRIGGGSGQDAALRLDKASSSVRAVRSALVDGVVHGGACAFIRADRHARRKLGSSDVERYIAGAMAKVAGSPLEAMLRAGNLDASATTRAIADAPDERAFDLAMREFCAPDRLADPVAVLQAVLRNSASLALGLSNVRVLVRTPLGARL